MIIQIMQTDFPDGSVLEMVQNGTSYAVTYGKHTESNLSMPDALEEYKSCIDHALNLDDGGAQ